MLARRDHCLEGWLVRERYRTLLRQMETEQAVHPTEAGSDEEPMGKGSERSNWALDHQGDLLSLSGWSAERARGGELGRQLGRLSYHYYSELLAQGLGAEEALELTKALVGRLVSCEIHSTLQAIASRSR